MLDGHDITDLEKRLADALAELDRHTETVAWAKQIREFGSDLRKNLLAKYKLPHLKAGESDAKAESYARADESYQTELAELREQFQSAEKHVTRFDVAMAKFDAARSLLSMAKAQLPATHHQGSRNT